MLADLELKFQQYQFKSNRGQFYRDLAETMEATPEMNIGAVLTRYATRYSKLPLGMICQVWLDRFQHTGRFAAAVKGTVPDTDYAILAASESSGSLLTGLKVLSQNLIAVSLIQKSIQKAATSFFIMLALFCTFVGIYSYKVVPTLKPVVTQIIPADEINLWGQILFAMSSIVQSYWYLILLALVVIVFSVYYTMFHYVGRYRTWLDDHILPYQLYRDINGSALLMSVASLTRTSGSAVMQITEALELVQKMNKSKWTQWQIARILEKAEIAPNSRGEIFNTGVVSQSLYYRILDLSDYMDMDKMLEKVGELILSICPPQAEKKAMAIRVAGTVTLVFLMIGLYVAVGKLVSQLQVHSMLQ